MRIAFPKAQFYRGVVLGATLFICAGCVIEPGYDQEPAPAYGYYGYGPDYPWNVGPSVNIYGGSGYHGYHHGGGFHGGGGGHFSGGGPHGGGHGGGHH